MGGLALLETGDRVRIDLDERTVERADCATTNWPRGDAHSKRRAATPFPRSQTPWQEIQRALVGQLASGAILEGSEKFQRIAQTSGLPRDNH